MSLYCLIMAGGSGKRFWPLGRKTRPKQFLDLLGGGSMLRKTVDRVLPLTPIERVFIITVSGYEEETLEQIPELPESNLLVEPVGKNTGPCIAYGASWIYSLDPDAVLLVLPADHAIGDEGLFIKAIESGVKASDIPLDNGEKPLVTFGVAPLWADTGYGYIEAGDEINRIDGHTVREVSKFVEKPTPEVVETFLQQGSYYWNSGIFVWKVETILDQFSMYLPEWTGHIEKLKNRSDSVDSDKILKAFYGDIAPGPIDKLIVEKSKTVVFIPVDFPWSDLGSWESLDRFLRTEGDENIVFGEADFENSSGCFVISGGKRIGVVGLNNVIVINTQDSILVLDKEDSQLVKTLVEKLEKTSKEIT